METGKETADDLVLRFNPSTIGHLGSNMYSRLPNAVAELVANAYDADSGEVTVQILESAGEPSIVVTDDGHGMNVNDLQEKYLQIGRNRREAEHSAVSESGRRKVSGKKGLGKLALFGVGERVEVSTTRRGSSELLTVTLDWDDINSTTSGDYHPQVIRSNEDEDAHGTRVTVSKLTRKTDISAEDLASSLSRLFQYDDDDMHLWVTKDPDVKIAVNRELRLASVEAEFVWQVPDDIEPPNPDLEKFGITGSIVAARKPLPTAMRGFTVYANGRLANEPEFFGAPDSSYAYNYLTGFLSVDILDTIQPDVVSTDRRSINWENEAATPIRDTLQTLVSDVVRMHREMRRQQRDQDVEKTIGLTTQQWVDSIRGPEKEPLGDLLQAIESEESDFSPENREKIVTSLKGIAPPYADMVWRHLHEGIRTAAEPGFKRGDYRDALVEACKQYVSNIRAASNLPEEAEASLFGKAFGQTAILTVAERYRSGSPCISGPSADNMENGQRELSKAIWTAFRNPLSHEPQLTIDALGVITHHDCLDALSLMSYLSRQLSNAELRETD